MMKFGCYSHVWLLGIGIPYVFDVRLIETSIDFKFQPDEEVLQPILRMFWKIDG
jgi:hypothetical protein